MSVRRRRRAAPAPQPVAEDRSPEPESEDNNPQSETEPAGEPMNDNKESKPVLESKPALDNKPNAPVLFALSRCRYRSGNEIVTAERGDRIENPDPVDLNDLFEHDCVETFDPSQVEALFSLRSKNEDARKRLARAIGII